MDGIVVQTSLTGSGGVLLVVCIFLFLAETQVTVHQLYRAGGEATVLSISLLLPKEREGGTQLFIGDSSTEIVR